MKKSSLLILLLVGVFIAVGFIIMVSLFFADFDAGLWSGEKVAIIDMKGPISDSSGPLSASINPEEAQKLFRAANEEDSIKAIVLRVNSPGGGVVASKELMRIVKSSEKPVVAWVGDMAASGAYYMISGADHIVADEDSLIGGIGVITTLTTYEELFKKIGINVTVIASGKYKDLGSSHREPREDEIENLEHIVGEIHKHFLEDIANNRELSQEQVDEISEGRLFLGSEALEKLMVDENGGFQKAFEKAKNVAESPDAEPYYMDAHSGLAEELFGLSYSLGRGVGDSFNVKLKQHLST